MVIGSELMTVHPVIGYVHVSDVETAPEPPAIRTRSSARRVAVCWLRANCIVGPAVQKPPAGLKNSVVAPPPPETSTRPSPASTAAWAYRDALIGASACHVFKDGSNESTVFVAVPAAIPP